jgi:hypothetical protein
MPVLSREGRSLRSPIVQVCRRKAAGRALHGALVRLERSAVKVACSVLRGLGEGDLAWLPGANHDASVATQHEKRTAERYSGGGLRRRRGRDALVLRAR